MTRIFPILKDFFFLSSCSWSGSHFKWGQSFRIRHITTGRYLCLDEEKGLLVVDPERANTKLSAFCFRVSKVRIKLTNFFFKIIFSSFLTF